MTTTLLNGTATAAAMLDRLRHEVRDLTLTAGRAPLLATVLIGDDPASHTYVRMKRNRARDVGIETKLVELPAHTDTAQAAAAVAALSEDERVDGILVQHPAPAHIDEARVFEAIDPAKDVDGVTSASLASMAFGTPGFRSATPGGIMALLAAFQVPLAGRHAVVVGRSRILGIPMGLLLMGANATVTYCHSRTADLPGEVGRADVVVAAAGRPGLIRGEWIKPGAAVIDAGYADNTGDVDFDTARTRAGFITPVPGGVGPMTIACLLQQTVQAARFISTRGNLR